MLYTPKLTIRSFSTDQYQLDKSFYSNSYKIKSFADAKPVIVDIGAFAGYFSFFALSAGAGKVYCFEPYLDNYLILIKNLTENLIFNGECIPHQLGVYIKDTVLSIPSPELINKSYFDYANISILNKSNKYNNIYVIKLDTILNNIVKEPVDLLKFNIGYAENAILSSSDLSKVSHICGEITGSEKEQLGSILKSKGFINLNFLHNKEEDSFIYQGSKVDKNQMFL